MKINRENFGWIATCVGLTILLILSLYLGISGYFFKTQISYVTEFEVGEAQDASILKNEASVLSLNLEGSFLEGERIPQIISVKNLSDEKLYLRAKSIIYTQSNQTQRIDIEQTINWKYNEQDGYYYFNDYINPGEKVSLCSHIVMSENAFITTNRKYIVSFVFESLDENQNVEGVWGLTPMKIFDRNNNN